MNRWWLSVDGACLALAALFGLWVAFAHPDGEIVGVGLALWFALTLWWAKRAHGRR